MCADFIEDVHALVEFPWRTIIPQLIRDAIKKWTSLKEHMKQRYIEREKYEYFLYTGNRWNRGRGVGVVEFCYIEKQIFVLLRSTLLRYQNPIALCLTSFPKILYENKPQPNNDYKYKKGPSKGGELVDGIIMKTLHWPHQQLKLVNDEEEDS